jgi:hypothetical protein
LFIQIEALNKFFIVENVEFYSKIMADLVYRRHWRSIETNFRVKKGSTLLNCYA